MTWSVDNVETVIFPETSRRRRLNGNTALLLLFHKVSGRSTVMYFTDFMDFTCQFQNPFSGGSLTRVNVRENTDISIKR